MLCVFLCSHRLSAHSVSWLAAWGVVCVLLFLHRWSALVGWLSVLECAFWGFLPMFTLLHLFPLSRLSVTHLLARAAGCQVSQGAEVPYED